VKLLVAVLTVTHAYACSCGGPTGRTAWEVAGKVEQAYPVIFEGTLQSFRIEWNFLTAKPGELVRADAPRLENWADYFPRMLATFRVSRAYKGDIGSSVQVRTGLGGGDCGFAPQPGLKYLVYAEALKSAVLWTSICSPGGWLGGSGVGALLRHLRKERPAPDDLKPYRLFAIRDRQEDRRRYAAATGQICGQVATATPIDGRIAFLPTTGSSLYEGRSDVKSDGKFCSERRELLHVLRRPNLEHA